MSDRDLRAALEAAYADQEAGRIERAVSGYEAVLRRSPRQPHALHMLAMLEAQRGRPEAALSLFRRAVEAAPRSETVLRNFAGFLLTQGRLDEAIPLYRKSVALAPGLGKAHAALGAALRQKGDDAGARAACEEAVRLDPHQTLAHLTLASIQRERGRLAEAIASCRRVLEYDPGEGRARAPLLYLLRQICAWEELEQLEAELDRNTANALAADRCPGEPAFVAVGRRMDPDYALAVARGWATEIARRAVRLPPPAPASGARIRVGYLSGDFHDHATAHLIRGVFPAHDRAAFEVFAYSYGPDDGSAYRQALIEGCDRFVDIAELGHRAAAERIRADGIEVLVDLKGHTQGNRLEILAFRPAPVQATWLGFPGSTGAAYIDYALVDAVVAPPADARYFSERLVHLPGAYLATDDAQAIAAVPDRTEAGLDSGVPVLASFNQPYKLEPEIFAIWMRVLGAVPGALLWLLDGAPELQSNLRAAAARAGIDPARLRFAPRLPKDRHLARLTLADLTLDTRIYNGHTTTVDSLWAGVPVLTSHGNHFASRVSASLLGAVGLPELVAPDLAAYERTAFELVRDPQRLSELRAKLAVNRRSRSLFDTAGFVRGLERAYRRMSEIARSGHPSEAIDLRAPT